MTPDCVRKLLALRENEDFCALSVEALLVEAVTSSSIEQVRALLDMIEQEQEARTVDQKFHAIAARSRMH